jgi:AsmA protein
LSAVTGIKRLAIGIVAFVAAGLCALLVLSALMPADTVREAVKAEIRAVTGLDPVLRGQVSVSLFPTGTVSFDDVSLGDNRTGAAALTAAQLVARLRFIPFLTGRIEIADISLVRPTINVTVMRDGRSNWSSHFETLARALEPDSSRSNSFSEIRIGDGTVIVGDETGTLAETLTNVELSLAWPSISRTFAVTGHFVWRDQRVDTTVSLGDFVAALAGRRSGLKIRLAGEPMKVSFDGHMSHRPTLKMAGTLAADAASLRQVLLWTGLQPLPGGGFGRFALKAKTDVSNGTISLSGVNIELDGNVGEGVLTYAADGRQTLQGTLATEDLNLTPYLSAVRVLAGGSRDWDRVPIALDGLAGIDADLRLSAARVTIANAKLGRTAVVTNLRAGNLTVTIGESQAFGGVVKGSLGLASSPNGAAMKTRLQFADVNLDQTLGELFGLRRLEGKGNLGLDIEGTGDSIYELTRALNGTANLTSRNGAIVGLNVEQLLRRLERRPLSGGNEFRTGRTPYDTLTVKLLIRQGTADIQEVRIEGPTIRLALGGSASIPARDLDLTGTASLLAATANAGDKPTPKFELPFIVSGPWDDPIMLPDPQILMQRSGAAAPLLDAVRNRNTRDAMRSAIERFTGAAPAKPAPDAETTPAAEPEPQSPR